MNTQSRRYIFIDFKDLSDVKFKKLEKICTKVFIFYGAEEEFIPLRVVRQMQKMGKTIKWIPVANAEEGIYFHLSFLMGKLHEKVSGDIEFAILSNDESYDPLVDFINLSGRSCLRVKISKPDERKLSDEQKALMEIPEEEAEVVAEPSYANFGMLDLAGGRSTGTIQETLQVEQEWETEDLDFIEKAAEETIKRLIRSGNRPSDISMLKSYIILHNQDEVIQDNIDRIIQHMEEINDIQVENEEVIYNF